MTVWFRIPITVRAILERVPRKVPKYSRDEHELAYFQAYHSSYVPTQRGALALLVVSTLKVLIVSCRPAYIFVLNYLTVPYDEIIHFLMDESFEQTVVFLKQEYSTEYGVKMCLHMVDGTWHDGDVDGDAISTLSFCHIPINLTKMYNT